MVTAVPTIAELKVETPVTLRSSSSVCPSTSNAPLKVPSTAVTLPLTTLFPVIDTPVLVVANFSLPL